MVRTCICHCYSHLDWLWKASKLDYYFIASTSLVPVIFLLGFSIAGLIKAASNTASSLLEHTHIINHVQLVSV